MKLKKMISAVVAVTMAASLLTGCGGNKAEDSKSEDSKTEENKVEDGKADKTDGLSGSFTYWTHNGPAFVKATEKTIAEFEKLHPNVTIKLQTFPYDVIMDKMSTAFAAGTEADLIQGYGSWFQQLIRNGKLASVPDDMLAAEKDNYFEPALAGYEYEGKYYGMPREVNIEYGLFYNKEDLKKAGAETIPDNFDDFLKIAQKMTEKDKNGNVMKAGFDYYNWDNSFTLLLAWILQQGGSYFQEDGVHVNFTSPEAKKAFQIMTDMAKGPDAVTDIKRITEQDNIEQIFFKGRSASMTKGSWAGALGKEMEIPADSYGFTWVPPLAGQESMCVSEAGWAEVVSAKSENKELVWEYLRFAMDKDNAAAFNKETGTLPARKDVAQDPQFQSADGNKDIKDAYTMLEWAKPMGVFTDGDFIRDNIKSYLERTIHDKMTVDEALTKMEKEVNDHFDKILKK